MEPVLGRIAYIAFLCLIMFGLTPTPGYCATPPPAESISKLEDIFAKVADNLSMEIESAWHEGRLDVCIELSRLVVEVDPSYVEAYGNGAWLLSSAGKDAEAVALYKKGIAANPNRYEVYFELGMYYYRKKDFANAEVNFSAATKHAPPAFVWKILAHSLEKLGRLEDSLAAWDKAKAIDPKDPVIEINMSRIREKLAGK